MIFEQPIRVATYSGATVDLADPVGSLRPDDVVVPLSRLARFNGAFPGFYSVAEHSLLVADIIRSRRIDPRIELAALLHDAAEAFVGDLIAPIKNRLIEFAALEHRVLRWIAREFGFDGIYARPDAWSRIEAADRDALDLEQRFRAGEPVVGIRCLEPRQAERAFRGRLSGVVEVVRQWDRRVGPPVATATPAAVS